MAGSQIPTGITILNSYLGYFGCSLTNFNTSASTAIAQGSKIEIAGAFFTFGSDDTPDATSWTAIVTGTTAYLALTPSGTAGSQIVSAAWTSTAPTWSTSKQGWYTSAGSNIRLIASVYKTSATQYDKKTILTGWQVENSHGSDRFVASGSWTCPSGVYQAWVTGCGRGGTGGVAGTAGNGYSGGGGGGAAFCVKYKINVVPLTVYTISIGTAGTNFGSGAIILANGGDSTLNAVGTGGSCTPAANSALGLYDGMDGGIGGFQHSSTGYAPNNGEIGGRGKAGKGGGASWYSVGGTLVVGGGGGGASLGDGGDGGAWAYPSSRQASYGSLGGGGGGDVINGDGTSLGAPGAGGDPELIIEW